MLPATKRVSEQCDETAKRMKEGPARPPCTRFFKSASPDPKDAAALRASLGASGIKLIDLQQARGTRCTPHAAAGARRALMPALPRAGAVLHRRARRRRLAPHL